MTDYDRLRAEAERLVDVVQHVSTDTALMVVMDALVALYRRTQDDTIAEIEACLLRATDEGGSAPQVEG